MPFPGEPDRHPVPTPKEMAQAQQAGPGRGWSQPEHGSTSRQLPRVDVPAMDLTEPRPVPAEWRDMFAEVFDEHIHTFFTNYVKRVRRVAIAVPVFPGATNIINGPGFLLGWSLQGASGKLATFVDSLSGFSNPLLAVGFDARAASTDSLNYPVHFQGSIVATLNDPSIFGVLYIEKTIPDYS